MNPNLPNDHDRFMRLPEVKRRVGLGRSTIYRRMREGSFPLPRNLGGRAVGWSESDVAWWIATRPQQGTVATD